MNQERHDDPDATAPTTRPAVEPTVVDESAWGRATTGEPQPTPPLAAPQSTAAPTARSTFAHHTPYWATQQLPPTTAAPSPPPPAAPPVPSARGEVRAPRWVLPFALLAALALFAGGALAGWAVASRDDGPDGELTSVDAGGDTAPVSDPVDPLVGPDAEEPVAAVAEAVAPSVVQIETDTGLGSGVVFDDEGHILTAAHVLQGANQLRVRLADGTLVPAEIIGTNAPTDVGVVAIEPRDDLELVPATLGVDADIQVGQLAVAVGSPFGLDQTITSGVVSALDRPVQTEGSSIVGMIQTDASINPGNSGGALADRFGRIIGINDAIRTSGGGNEGVGFAIPIDLAVRVAEQLIAGEDIQAGLLGVTVSDPTDGEPGALIGEIMPGSPAASSGLEVGDLITAIEGESISGTQNLRAEILSRPPGTTVTVEVLRDGERREFDVTLTSATD